MKKQEKLGPVSAQERRDYRSKLGSDAAWGRPSEAIARAVWALLERHLPYRLEDFMVKSRTPFMGEEYDQAALVAKQSAIVALDYAIRTGDHVRRDGRSKMLKNLQRLLRTTQPPAPSWSKPLSPATPSRRLV